MGKPDHRWQRGSEPCELPHPRVDDLIRVTPPVTLECAVGLTPADASRFAWKNICPPANWRAALTPSVSPQTTKGRSIPADLTVRGPREDSVTVLDGSRIRHDVAYTDREFTPEGLTEVLAPPSAHE